MRTDWLELHEQFVLCRDPRQIPGEWSSHAIREWHLGHHASLPVATLLARDHVEIGWLLGYAISGRGVLIDSAVVAAPFDSVALTPAAFEDWLYGHGGRFLTVLLTNTLRRVYLDPCGSLSTVFCRELECVASTVSAIAGRRELRQHDDDGRSPEVAVKGMYPLVLTPRKDVWRLLPNHFLDLSAWRAVRHWPTADSFAVRETTLAISQIVERVRLHIGALTAKRSVLMRLTAGLDSRMLLACARPYVESMTFFTVAHRDPASWLDCSTAAHIARDLRLRYMRLPYLRPRPEDLDEWLFRTGSSVRENKGWLACTTYKQLPARHADLIALVGELARGFYWKPEDTEGTTIGPDRLLAIFGEELPSSRDAVGAWLESLPCQDPFLVLDLFYVEQRLGCWGGVYPYAYGRDGRFQLFPLCHREIIEAVLSLPKSVRGGDLLARQVMEQEWPELLGYPFNRPRGRQKLGMAWVRARRESARAASRLSRAISHPTATTARILGRLRSRAG